MGWVCLDLGPNVNKTVSYSWANSGAMFSFYGCPPGSQIHPRPFQLITSNISWSHVRAAASSPPHLRPHALTVHRIGKRERTEAGKFQMRTALFLVSSASYGDLKHGGNWCSLSQVWCALRIPPAPCGDEFRLRRKFYKFVVDSHHSSQLMSFSGQSKPRGNCWRSTPMVLVCPPSLLKRPPFS